MSAMTIADKIAAYIKIRDFKAAASEEFKKSMDRANAAMEKLEAELLDELNKTGARSLACPGGTVYRQRNLSATIADHQKFFHEFVVVNALWDAVDIKANKTFVREYMDKNAQPIPGLNVTQIDSVGIRRS